MTAALSPHLLAEIVARLRKGGCVFAEDEAELLVQAAEGEDRLDAMVERRVAGEPIEYVVGWAEFCGLRVKVEPGVFVPRRRTEFLVGEAVRHAPPSPVVVDLCCGAGALGAVLGTVLAGAEVHAADVDPAAVRCARGNLPAERVYEGDLFAALPADLKGRIDVLAANVPYVPSDEIGLLPAEAREHEARVALDGGPDGLDVLRRVAGEAARWLAPGGRVFVETSERQAPEALAAFRDGGLAAAVLTSEEWYATVVTGTKLPI